MSKTRVPPGWDTGRWRCAGVGLGFPGILRFVKAHFQHPRSLQAEKKHSKQQDSDSPVLCRKHLRFCPSHQEK